jgi:hypothetical protein
MLGSHHDFTGWLACVLCARTISSDPNRLVDAADRTIGSIQGQSPNLQIGNGIEVSGEAVEFCAKGHLCSPLPMVKIYRMYDYPSISYVRNNRMGRKKLWTTRLTLPLDAATIERMDAALQDQEARLDLIREAIERELKRRERRA